MDDVQLWRELGQQFRVDSVRCAAAAKSEIGRAHV